MESDYILMMAMQALAIVIGLLILGWMMFAHRRARRNQKSLIDSLGFLPLRNDIPPALPLGSRCVRYPPKPLKPLWV